MKRAFVRGVPPSTLWLFLLVIFAACSGDELPTEPFRSPETGSISLGVATVDAEILLGESDSESAALGVNDGGLVVGRADYDAVQWTVTDEGGSWRVNATGLGLGGVVSEATGVNLHGLIVASSYEFSAGGYVGYQCTGPGACVDIGKPSFVSNAWPVAVNDVGDLAAQTIGSGSPAYAKLETGGWADLPGIVSTAGTATDISNSAIVAGYATTVENEQQYEAVIWESTNPGVYPEATGLGQLTAGGKSGANAIAKNRIVAGWATDGSARRPVVWENGQIRDLGTLGGSEGEAFDVNDDGFVVGESEGADGVMRATLWTPDGDVVELSDKESSAFALNMNGWIVGSSINTNGDEIATLWIISSDGGGGGVPSTIEELEAAVEQLFDEGSLNKGQARGLLSKLDKAGRDISKSEYRAANILSDFVVQLEDLVDEGMLTEEEAGPLIEGANLIIDDLRS